MVENVPQLAEDLHIRVSREELDTLREMAAGQQAVLSSVVRAMIRHFSIKWNRGEDVTMELGAVVWNRKKE